MTQEEKQLLLKDLSQRVSSAVCIFFEKTCGVFTLCGVKVYNMFPENDILVLLNDKYPIQWCKPYLRPMSSMTKEEILEYLSACNKDNKDILIAPRYLGLDYLLSHYLDFHGLIPMGLALEAPEGMYKNF